MTGVLGEGPWSGVPAILKHQPTQRRIPQRRPMSWPTWPASAATTGRHRSPMTTKPYPNPPQGDRRD